MTPRRRVVVGNWKMHTDRRGATALAFACRQQLDPLAGVETGVCPPFVWLPLVADVLKGSSVSLGAQDVCERPIGASTGDVAAEMLADLGCRFAIAGHSERRRFHGEGDATVRAKAAAALEAGLSPIVCVGETLPEREAGRVEEVVGRQVTEAFRGMPQEQAGRCLLAYEPVWAIGTGRNATPAEAREVHRFIRELLARLYTPAFAAGFRIQYGGSVNAGNAAALLGEAELDGALVGGASLDPVAFAAIVRAAGR